MSAPAMNVRPSQMMTIALAPSLDRLVDPVEQALADVRTEGVDGRIVDDDEGDVALGLEADGFGDGGGGGGGHVASQAVAAVPPRFGRRAAAAP